MTLWGLDASLYSQLSWPGHCQQRLPLPEMVWLARSHPSEIDYHKPKNQPVALSKLHVDRFLTPFPLSCWHHSCPYCVPQLSDPWSTPYADDTSGVVFFFFPKTASCCDPWTWQGSPRPPGPHQASSSWTMKHFLIIADMWGLESRSEPKNFPVLVANKGLFRLCSPPFSHLCFSAFTAACNLCKETTNPEEWVKLPRSPFTFIMETSLHVPGIGQVVKSKDLITTSYFCVWLPSSIIKYFSPLWDLWL